jgi:GNAT superfamily N-acetyltransferase
VVGFATAWVRGTLWYLSSLFVLPRWQGRGVGSELLRHAMAGQPAPGGIVAVVSSAANPTSNRLYARRGMYALTPVLYLRGRLATLPPARRRRGVAQLHATPLTTGDLGHLRAVDRAVTGLDRTVDHLWLLGEARRSGWLFRRGESPVAYAYLGGDGTQGDDAVGPIAALTPRDQQVALRFVLAQAADRGSATATLTVPGVNLGAQRMLWQAGFAFDGAAALLCASRPFGRFDRYLLAGDALL